MLSLYKIRLQSSLFLFFNLLFFFFFFNDPPTTDIYTLSLHDALPISSHERSARSKHTRSVSPPPDRMAATVRPRSEEHTSELQSRFDLVCRLLLEKKKQTNLNNLKQTSMPCKSDYNSLSGLYFAFVTK